MSEQQQNQTQMLQIENRTVFWRIQSRSTGDRFGDFPRGDLSQIILEIYYHTIVQVEGSMEVLGQKDPQGIIILETSDAPEAFAAIAAVAQQKLAERLSQVDE